MQANGSSVAVLERHMIRMGICHIYNSKERKDTKLTLHNVYTESKKEG